MKLLNVILFLLFGIGLLYAFYIGLKVKDQEPKILAFESMYNYLYLEHMPNGRYKITSEDGNISPYPLTSEDALHFIQEVKARDIQVSKRIPKTCTAYTLQDMVYVYSYTKRQVIDSFYLPFKNILQ